MFQGRGVGEDPGSIFLHILEPVQGFGTEPGQDSITIGQVGGDEGMSEAKVVR